MEPERSGCFQTWLARTKQVTCDICAISRPKLPASQHDNTVLAVSQEDAAGYSANESDVAYCV